MHTDCLNSVTSDDCSISQDQVPDWLIVFVIGVHTPEAAFYDESVRGFDRDQAM